VVKQILMPRAPQYLSWKNLKRDDSASFASVSTARLLAHSAFVVRRGPKVARRRAVLGSAEFLSATRGTCCGGSAGAC